MQRVKQIASLSSMISYQPIVTELDDLINSHCTLFLFAFVLIGFSSIDCLSRFLPLMLARSLSSHIVTSLWKHPSHLQLFIPPAQGGDLAKSSVIVIECVGRRVKFQQTPFYGIVANVMRPIKEHASFDGIQMAFRAMSGKSIPWCFAGSFEITFPFSSRDLRRFTQITASRRNFDNWHVEKKPNLRYHGSPSGCFMASKNP